MLLEGPMVSPSTAFDASTMDIFTGPSVILITDLTVSMHRSMETDAVQIQPSKGIQSYKLQNI